MSCNLKTKDLLDCVLIRVCAVIRSKTLFQVMSNKVDFSKQCRSISPSQHST